MATPRRSSPSETKSFEGTGDASSSEVRENSDTSPAVSSDVIYKLLGFTMAMIIAPIGIYFLSLHTIFRGNSTYAGATAAVTANLVLVAYIIVAMREDRAEKVALDEKRKMKKAQ